MITDSDEPDIFLTMVTPDSKCDERSENLGKTLLQIQCILSLNAEFLTLKNFVVGEINMITEKLIFLPSNEHTLWQELTK